MSARRVNTPLAAAAAVTLLCVVATLLHLHRNIVIPGLDWLELATIDLRYAVRGTRAVRGDVVIVGLDDTLRRRDREAFMKHAAVAGVVRAIAQNHPRAIAIDLFFDSPDAVLPPGVLLDVKRAREEALAVAPDRRTPPLQHAAAALGEVLDASRGDEELAAALRAAGNVQLAAIFFLDDETQAPPAGSREPPGLRGAAYDEYAVVDRAPTRRPPRAERSVYASIDLLAEAANGAGFVNVSTDRDGRVREVFGAIEYAGSYYLPLGFSLAKRAPGAGTFGYATNAPEIHFGDRRLPVDERGRLMLDWPGPWGTFPFYSAADVLDGSIPKGSLDGKLVLVGLTDAVRDRVQTPFGEQPGVAVHAVLAEGALRDGFLRAATPPWTLAFVLLLAAIPTVLQIRAVRSRGAWIPGAAGLLGAVLWFAVAQILFSRDQRVVNVAAPSLAAIVTAVAALGAALATEEREKRRLRGAFSRYVSDVVAERILESPDAAGLEGVRREVTVLFSDIRGFSEFSERLEPDVLRQLLVEYFTPMSDAVLSEEGLLDKFIGDAVMAFWGAPLDVPDHAARACRSALQMLRSLARLNEDWHRRGLPEIRIGVGINTGLCSVGNMGSERRFNYTAVGDAVNLSSRLETLTKQYHVAVIVGESTRAAVGDAFRFRELDRVKVVGRVGTTRIFELLDESVGAELTSAYEKALATYRAGDFEGAEREFAALTAAHPHDGPSATMLARVRTLKDNPPPAGWDGVFHQISK